MISQLNDVKKVTCTVWHNRAGWDMGVVLAIEDGSAGVVAIATPSWHVDFDDPITWPAIQNHREEWLADCHYGDSPPTSKALYAALKDWLADADLSALSDSDDAVGHKELADSCANAIRAAKAAHQPVMGVSNA